MSETDRIADLEARLAFQEDALDKMSDVIAKQSQEIDRMNVLLKHIHSQVKLIGQDAISAPDADVPPPHY
ncbi:SlyX family protein [Aliamphritea spongicola]|uniref:SlyX family protein n=1 Tax=Aliamphritea spongicola TaxID=707589 RepID=UPI00196A794E|nr:SlyX family protein [Aliamphritea spongicola]MBN3562681.1 SlyX family protein [Aliamphritea spongicola]